MAYQVILSPTVENDLDGIVACVARENAAAAERLGLVAGAGFEPAIRRSPDYEPDERTKPVSL
jgi:plasmid stabilization system protein ParE